MEPAIPSAPFSYLMTKRYAILSIFLILISLCAGAQKKEIAQAQNIIKSGKDVYKAEQQMRSLLNDSVHRKNLKVWATLTDAMRSQYLAGNEKMYLRQKQDTAALFRLALQMFSDYQSMDSVDATPDAKGRVKLKYRGSHAEFLDNYRPNLYHGGIFFIRKQDYKNAYSMLDAFLDCLRQPLFCDSHYEKDSLNCPAAFWTVYCGYQLQNYEMAVKYKDLALRDSLHLDRCLQYFAEFYSQRDENEQYEAMLMEGLQHYPESPYFFSHLIDYCNTHEQQDKAMKIVDDALANDSTSELFLFAKSSLLLNLGEYDSCIAICDTLISRNDSLADPYYNAGVSYMNKAFLVEKGKMGARQRRQVRQHFRQALPYLERYRVLAPDEKQKWGPALYNIYLRLNMGKEFEEIDRILR